MTKADLVEEISVETGVSKNHTAIIVDGMIDAVCRALHGKIPSMSEVELDLCYRELKALCDGRERLQIVRLLAHLATADGAMSPAEHEELVRIAEEIGIPISELEAVERETLPRA